VGDKNCYDKLADTLELPMVDLLRLDTIDWKKEGLMGPSVEVEPSADVPAPKVHFSWLIPEEWGKKSKAWKIRPYESATGIVTVEPVGREGMMVGQHNDRGDK